MKNYQVNFGNGLSKTICSNIVFNIPEGSMTTRIDEKKKSYLDDFILKVLSLYAKYGLQSCLTYRTDGEYAPITFWADSSQDLFGPMCNTDVTLTSENLPLFEQALRDCFNVSKACAYYGLDLFICRTLKRKPDYTVWPQSEVYRRNEEYSPLFLKIKFLFDSVQESDEILEG